MTYSPKDGITQSLISNWLSCRMKARLYIDGWRQDSPRRDALDFGNLFHAKLEHYYSGSKVDTVKAWRDKCKSEGPVNVEDMEVIECQFETLWPFYQKAHAKADAKLTWNGRLEELFDVSWNGHRLRGKIDGLPTVGRKLWTFETKTKAQIDEDSMMLALEMDLQNMYYITALQTKKQRPIGVIYNVIRRPGLKYDINALPAYQKKLTEAVQKEPDHYFKRYEVTYTDKQLVTFQKELLHALNEYTLWSAGKIPTYKNTTACVGRGQCQYLKLCASAMEASVGYNQDGELFKELGA